MVGARLELDNVVASVASEIELKCTFSHGTCENVSWSRVEEPVGIPAVLYVNNRMSNTYNGRYSVNADANGACTLHIAGLRLSDAGTFTCSESVPGASRQAKKTATLTVIGILRRYIYISKSLKNLVSAKQGLAIQTSHLSTKSHGRLC